jgi:hypothetical protein
LTKGKAAFYIAITKNQTESQMLTKKHFISEAARIASMVATGGDLKTLRELASKAADDYARQNSRFDRSRFLAACGV